MPSRQLLVVLTCLASLLGVAHWFERPSSHQLQTPFPTAPLVAAAASPPEEEPPSTTDKHAEQCTIVFIHNRKGCVFDRRAHLKEAGADAAIPNPQPIPSASASTAAAKAWDGSSELGWAAAAALGDGGTGPVIPELGKRRPKGEAYGPPQTTVWRDHTTITASEALDLQPLFDVRPLGYGGADVAASFRAPPLDGDGGKPHTMWLLGDTFLGRVNMEKGQRLPGYFVHNSVAVVPVWQDPAKNARPEQIAFWHNVSAGGCPSSLFRHPSELAAKEENECHEGGQYLWPVAGVGVDLSGDAQEDPSTASKLVLLATRWAYLPWIEEDVDLTRSVLNFEVLGTTLVVVDNARAPPPQWRYRTRDLPHTGAANNWFSGIAPAEPGVELVTRRDEMVYLLGTSGTAPLDSHQILGRVKASSLLDLSLDGMEVWSEKKPQQQQQGPSAAELDDVDKGAAVWAPLERYVKGEVAPLPLTSPVYTGISLQYSEHLRCWYSVAIDWMSRRAILQTAEEITGPWESTPIYDIPTPFNGTHLMAYTGKAHPELAAPDEIIFTYVANTPGLVVPLFEEGADVMYVPRFVRLKLDARGKGKRALRSRRWRLRGEAVGGQKDESEGPPKGHRALRQRRWKSGQQLEVRKPQQGGKQEEEEEEEGSRHARALRTRRRKRKRGHGVGKV